MYTSNRKGHPGLIVLIVLFTIAIAATLVFFVATDQGKAWADDFREKMPAVPTVEVESPKLRTNVDSYPIEIKLEEIQDTQSDDAIGDNFYRSSENLNNHVDE